MLPGLLTAALLCGLLLPGPAALRAADPPPGKPNFIVIFIDDMGYGDVGFNGATGLGTPHLDRLAAEGMKFDDFYVGCAVCSGSRASLLTGTHYKRLSMKQVLLPGSNTGLHPDELTIADMLKNTGYRTTCIGKWHLGHLPPCLPTYQGFDSYYGVPYSNDMWIDPANRIAGDVVVREGLTLDDMKAGHRKRNLVPLMRDEEIIEYPADQKTLTRRYTEEAVRYIKANKNEPFFIYLPHTMVHLPLMVSKEFEGRTGKLIWDAIEEVDWSVGRILDTLKAEGIDEKTLVVFTSDNGAAVGSSLPLRSRKGSVYDGGIREPTVMWWPGRIPAGRTCTEVAATIDLLPTFARLAGGKPGDRRIDGKDIWPLMSGDESAKSPHEHYVLMHGAGAVRSGKWKFYPWSEKGGKDRGARPESREPSALPVQLYDTTADISETVNLAEKHPEVVKRLRAVWEKHVSDIEATKRPAARMIRPEGALPPGNPREPNSTPLFNGLTLNNWILDDPESWIIANDMLLTCRMKVVKGKDGKKRFTGRGDLWSKHEFENFELVLDYKLSEGANSGIFYRADPADPVHRGFEIPLMDNEGFQKTHGSREAKRLSGSFNDARTPSSDPSRPVGQWNRLELLCEGPKIRLRINDRQVFSVNVDNWDTAGKNPDGSKNRFKTALKDLPRSGHIGLQNHGQQVWFRDIQLKKL